MKRAQRDRSLTHGSSGLALALALMIAAPGQSARGAAQASGAGPETPAAATQDGQRRWAQEALARLQAAHVLDGHERELLQGDRPISSRDLAIIVAKLAQYAQEWHASDGRVFTPDELSHITTRARDIRGSLDATGSRLATLQDDIQSLRHDLEEIRGELRRRHREHDHSLPAGTISRY